LKSGLRRVEETEDVPVAAFGSFERTEYGVCGRHLEESELPRQIALVRAGLGGFERQQEPVGFVKQAGIFPCSLVRNDAIAELVRAETLGSGHFGMNVPAFTDGRQRHFERTHERDCDGSILIGRDLVFAQAIVDDGKARLAVGHVHEAVHRKGRRFRVLPRTFASEHDFALDDIESALDMAVFRLEIRRKHDAEAVIPARVLEPRDDFDGARAAFEREVRNDGHRASFVRSPRIIFAAVETLPWIAAVLVESDRNLQGVFDTIPRAERRVFFKRDARGRPDGRDDAVARRFDVHPRVAGLPAVLEIVQTVEVFTGQHVLDVQRAVRHDPHMQEFIRHRIVAGDERSAQRTRARDEFVRRIPEARHGVDFELDADAFAGHHGGRVARVVDDGMVRVARQDMDGNADRNGRAR